MFLDILSTVDFFSSKLTFSKKIFQEHNQTDHWVGSFEYSKHMFWLRNKKNLFPITFSYLKACLSNTAVMVFVTKSMFTLVEK